MTKQTHHIDLDILKYFAHVGVRRAVIFMGLGLNAAHREDFLDYELRKIPSSTGERRFPIEFFPEALPTERVNCFKVEFARWIQDCCLRDLLEHHALFLDKVHHHALVVYRSLGKLAEKGDFNELNHSFRRGGIPNKHKTLRNRFGIDPAHSATIDQLYRARNALTHDLGYVFPERCDANGNFVLRWPKFSFIGIGNETGKETPLAAMIGERTAEETTIALRVEQRETTYKAGERIEFRTEDLEEVFNFFRGWAIPSALAAFVDFLKANGIRQGSASAPKRGS